MGVDHHVRVCAWPGLVQARDAEPVHASPSSRRQSHHQVRFFFSIFNAFTFDAEKSGLLLIKNFKDDTSMIYICYMVFIFGCENLFLK